ncbi:hypothetical protein IU449_22615 [Nocardia higoensis]|uniref:ABC-three component systems C-terminal domain-containing protein n=1 Tax=Nocardia higoensis TaxID=228599 RepID=A0ABS0DHF7_9NOCA|nr:ABC-three component system protein [Nocardia higoensis]MBF6357303.1 hypothetical protein [Nocardia higoensis]
MAGPLIGVAVLLAWSTSLSAVQSRPRRPGVYSPPRFGGYPLLGSARSNSPDDNAYRETSCAKGNLKAEAEGCHENVGRINGLSLAERGGMMGLQSANWRDWYRFRHKEECFHSGAPYEEYVATVLARFHDDFINPAPAGRLGDGGCDGIAESGTIAYACYGQRPGRNAENELAKKIRKDFDRAYSQWKTFETWRFVTNAPVGPKAAQVFVDLQQAHGAHPLRPLKIRHFDTEKLWIEVVSKLEVGVLNEIFPGVPGATNVEMNDLIPLLDKLGAAASAPYPPDTIRPVPPDKMEFNSLPESSRVEFNNGRLLAPRINEWYASAADPTLYDTHGDRFRALYRDARAVTTQPAEILERLYVAVAGSDARMDAKRANAAYAVVSYFFDSCHIFEEPPGAVAASGEEVASALAH